MLSARNSENLSGRVRKKTSDQPGRSFGTVIDVNSPPIANQSSPSAKHVTKQAILSPEPKVEMKNRRAKPRKNFVKSKLSIDESKPSTSKRKLDSDSEGQCKRLKTLKTLNETNEVKKSFDDFDPLEWMTESNVDQVKWMTEAEEDADYLKVLIHQRLSGLEETMEENGDLEKEIQQLRQDNDELEEIYLGIVKIRELFTENS